MYENDNEEKEQDEQNENLIDKKNLLKVKIKKKKILTYNH